MSNQTQTIVERVKSIFDFSVDKLPLSGPDNIKTPCYGLFRSDTGAFVGSGNNAKTKNYVPHTTDDVIALVEATEEVFGDAANVACSFSTGHYVTVVPSNEYRRSIYGQNDNIFPRLIIRAGYDGQAFSATVGYYRDLCKNLSMLRSVRSTTATIRHTNALRDHMRSLIDTFSYLKSGWDNLIETIEGMQAREVEVVSFVQEIYGTPDPDSQRAQTIHRNRMEAIIKRIIRERKWSGRPDLALVGDTTISAWEAYNAVQGYVQHEATRKSGTTDYNRMLLASKDKAVRKAEALAIAA